MGKKRTKMSAEERAYYEQENRDSHRVLAFEQTGPHKLKITFDDGKVSEIDFMPGLLTFYSGKLYEPFRDPEFFKQVFISDVGLLEWPGGLDFNPAHLYRWDDIMAEFGGSKPEIHN